MTKIFIIILRLIVIGLVSISAWLLSCTVYYIVPKSIWNYFIRAWSWCMRRTAGVKLKVVGKTNNNYNLKNFVVVANHISWLDTVILYALYAISFVGKVEMKRWPILNVVIKAGGTIFINRNNKRDILQANKHLTAQLEAGRCVGFFPEGQINNGRELLPFKASLLEAALTAKSRIIPIIILYFRRDGSIAEETFYYKKNLWQAVTRTLRLNGLTAKVFILPTVDSHHYANRQELANFLHQQMEQALHQHSPLALAHQSAKKAIQG